MKEKSQLEDMRAAVRGDIERARARREADPWRAQEPEQQLEPEPEPTEHAVADETVDEASTASEETGDEPVYIETVEEPVAVEGLTPKGSVPEETVAEPATAEAIEELAPQPEAPAGFLARLFRRR